MSASRFGKPMNTADIKRYAPQARRDFIAAVTDRAAMYGLTAQGSEPVTVQGDVAIIAGRAYPRSAAANRARLEERVQRDGFVQTMEAIAYTWFNRLAALRYMELHGYLDHGYRVLSHPDGHLRPEILDHAADIDLPGLDRARAVELKLDGTKDEELFRLLLTAQCNALHQAMPFLFEKIGDETELLLPANLLHSDSLIRKLVEEIDKESWAEIEIIGWLYQFYISEKKDEVIGKVVKSEDIPAATQLFTPNWIVKYMVQNSLGAQWLATCPESPLKGRMEYYIEPAEQTDEVKAQLAAITPNTLNPEELTLIDPASGSGHILVEAYELFKAIYLERGYRLRDIPQLILEKNLFGLDIDERAAQLTGFALMMKGRADDPRFFERRVKLNVMALVDSAGFDAEGLANGLELGSFGLKPGDLTELMRLFEHAATFGSLIQVPKGLAERLPALRQLSAATSQDLFVSEALKRLRQLIQQAEMLAARYDAVVANPPYMGSKGMNALVKKFVKDYFADDKSDLFACFIERGFTLARAAGHNAMVTMQTWMFLSSFEKMRERMLREKTITTMAQIGYNSFPSMNSKVARATVFTIVNRHLGNYIGVFINLNSAPQSADKEAVFLARNPSDRFEVSVSDFTQIPSSPLAYWISQSTRKAFDGTLSLSEYSKPLIGMRTGDNERFIRLWHEVAMDASSVRSETPAKSKWFPYMKGGEYRRWYGNNEYFVNWRDDGREIKENTLKTYPELDWNNLGWKISNESSYFMEAITWTCVSTSPIAARYAPEGALFDTGGSFLPFTEKVRNDLVLCYLNSKPAQSFLDLINPTINYGSGTVGKLPWRPHNFPNAIGNQLVGKAKTDWDAHERSWDFQSLPILAAASDPTSTLESSYTAWISENRNSIAEMKRLEEENNRLFIDGYGLGDELTPDVPIEHITLTGNPAYRYGGNLTEEEQWTRFREDTMQELVSYAIGCMMGRYSLDAPGLIYANSGNEAFDPSRYATFPPDQDGIVPITDTDWFDDDACHRLIEFVSVAWDKSHLEENLTFLAQNLSPRKNESSRETLRRYLSDNFFKDHLQTYKKRPIYWLFSSGKQRAFQALVYLHRYHEGTLARMRTEYVVPLQGMITSRIERLGEEIGKTNSTAQQKKLEKERDRLLKQRPELQAFDEKLRHYADMRIALDLDDGVKVNYGKFGDLLAEVKSVTGGDEE
jgi:type II restriction/modification system DNA methylase subunit YeeA